MFPFSCTSTPGIRKDSVTEEKSSQINALGIYKASLKSSGKLLWLDMKSLMAYRWSKTFSFWIDKSFWISRYVMKLSRDFKNSNTYTHWCTCNLKCEKKKLRLSELKFSIPLNCFINLSFFYPFIFLILINHFLFLLKLRNSNEEPPVFWYFISK